MASAVQTNTAAATATAPAPTDPAVAAWQTGHVAHFRKAAPPCHCFVCLAERAGRISIRRMPLQFIS